jgi:hypothetical protein
MSIPEPPRPIAEPESPLYIDFALNSINSVNRRKPIRRQSGMLLGPHSREAMEMERPLSPAPSSPARPETGILDDDEAEQVDLYDGEFDIEEVEYAPPKKEKLAATTPHPKKSSKIHEYEQETNPKEKKKKVSSDRETAYSATDSEPATKKVKSRLKDVTNSPRLSPVPPSDGEFVQALLCSHLLIEFQM